MCDLHNVGIFCLNVSESHNITDYFLAVQSGVESLVVFKHLCPCRTTYGKEYEVTAHTFLDSHKAEQDENHWIMCTSDPAGSKLKLVNNTQASADNTDCTQTT